MGYRLNRLDEPIFMAGPKPMRTEFGIHQRLESCVPYSIFNALFNQIQKVQGNKKLGNGWNYCGHDFHGES